MIRGYFNRGAPHIVAQVSIPCLSIIGPVIFAIDTGADETVLLPNEATMLGVKYSKLTDQPREATRGLGGEVPAFAVPATVMLKAGHYGYGFEIKLLIVEFDLEKDWMLTLPSVLGRDILNKLRTVYNFQKDLLTMTPIDWTRRFKLPPP